MLARSKRYLPSMPSPPLRCGLGTRSARASRKVGFRSSNRLRFAADSGLLIRLRFGPPARIGFAALVPPEKVGCVSSISVSSEID